MRAQRQDLQTTPSWQVANCKEFNVSSRNQSLQSWWHECVADAVLGPVWYPIENANPQAHSQWITVDSRWMIIRIIRPGLSPGAGREEVNRGPIFSTSTRQRSKRNFPARNNRGQSHTTSHTPASEGHSGAAYPPTPHASSLWCKSAGTARSVDLPSPPNGRTQAGPSTGMILKVILHCVVVKFRGPGGKVGEHLLAD